MRVAVPDVRQQGVDPTDQLALVGDPARRLSGSSVELLRVVDRLKQRRLEIIGRVERAKSPIVKPAPMIGLTCVNGAMT